MGVIICYMKEGDIKMTQNVALIYGARFVSNFLKSEMERRKYLMEAETEIQNAEILRANAQNIRYVGARNEDIVRSQNRAYLAQNRAIANEAGIGESPTLVSSLATAANALEQNVLNDRFKIESEAENYLYQSKISMENANQLKRKYKNSFGSSLLNSAINLF